MTQNDNIIHIVCGLDQNYAPHLATMLYSLYANNRTEKFVAHVLHDSIPQDIRHTVEQSVPQISFKWIEVSNHPVLDFKGSAHISRATFLRLLMAELLDKSIDRALYLDVDMIVCGSILELWTTDMQGKTCAAVVDPGVDAPAFAKQWNLDTKPLYFNAGVILFDMQKLRKATYMDDAITLLKSTEKKCEYGDQDALNIVLWNDWLPLDPKWNFQRKFLYDNYALWTLHAPANLRPAIIHYTEEYKPWRSTEWHPCGWLYLKSLLKTPFAKPTCAKGNIGWHHILKSWIKWTFRRPPMFKAESCRSCK